MNEALKSLETMKFDGGKHEPSFDLAVRKYRTHGAADGLDFQFAIYSDGFEATRNVSRDDLMTIRDWIYAALVASEAKKAA